MSDGKPSFFQKLFGRSKSSSSSGEQRHSSSAANKKEKRHLSSSDDTSNGDHQKTHHQTSSAAKLHTQTSATSNSGSGGGRSPSTLSPPVTVDGTGRPASPRSAPAAANQAPRSSGAAAKTKKRGNKHRKRGKAGNKPANASIDTSKPLEFPATPEMILAYHQAKPFLDKNEEWLMVELNEFECLVDGLEIVRTIAKHSKFFEVEPDELWEEFFEYVDEMPSYDEVINFDVWQEFRDNKYPC